MAHPYDALTPAQLRHPNAEKWTFYPPDVLPLWVADMDFPPAAEIRAAIAAYAAEGPFVYPMPHGIPGLREAVAARLGSRYGFAVAPEAVLPINGIVPALNVAVMALAGPGDEVIVQPPVYPPILQAVRGNHRRLVANELRRSSSGWEIDFEALEQAITPATRALILCNPHNPTGRVFTRAELEQLAEVALRHRLWVIADELHADLTYDRKHLPFAALDAEVAARTLTLYGPTKAFNLAGLRGGYAITTHEPLRERLRERAEGLLKPPGVLAQIAHLAAYQQADGWLDDTLAYLRANRDRLTEFVANELPGVTLCPPEGTYLAWLDFRGSGVPAAELERFFLEEAKVALNPGHLYGPGGDGYARLNFATSRAILDEALRRIGDALTARRG